MSAVNFDEQRHEYKRRGAVYTSVTTLIKKYEPPFDSEYWSTYKAIKDELSEHHEWRDYKWQAGGWESVVPYFLDVGHPRVQQIMVRKQGFLDMWAEMGRVAREKGTAVHKALEDEVNDALYVQDDHGDFLVPTHSTPMDPLAPAPVNAVMTEVIVYNDTYKIAGMIDRIDKKDNLINLRDHKTSKEITTQAFRDECLKPPVNHLPNANYFVYSLQLSLYAWILETFGYRIGTLTIDHRDRENGSLIESYPVNYLREDIEAILNDYETGEF